MISRAAVVPWIRRPAVTAALAAVALAGLLSGGAVVARAVDGTPASDTTAASPASADGANGNGDSNVAVAVNRTDGRDAYAVRLKVVITDDPVVDAGNAAVAVGSCSDCRTVAVALEGVLLTGNPEVVAPENIALAINLGCTNCETLAAAYQTVVSTGGRVRMTGKGRAEIAQLRRQLNTLRTRDLPFPELIAEINRIAGEFNAVLKAEVVPIGRPAVSGSPTATPTESAAAGETTGPGTTSEAGTTSATPGPTEGTQPSSTPDATPAETASPSPSPTG